ncbi:hypothetical protein CORC01_09150 [Colletotrichum orchidophilum]|uniref:Uncharacterized protein n=1 Tax=Colletotrichum orchidophilum TaxID=1209926 RepID=A0A1G4B2B9_9PEZI|nr:uncharacterized protein CORC01_09150 [Colletotrichum orchidophilum]OHE95560.1 hypothetical protein CORC01_09150 [Colletotrichum orchidophilum]
MLEIRTGRSHASPSQQKIWLSGYHCLEDGFYGGAREPLTGMFLF